SASFVQKEHRMTGLEAGADAYLVEPVEPGELVANIRALLRMRDAEAGLQQTRALLAAVVEASPLAIIVFDADGVIRRSNPAAERLVGQAALVAVGGDDGTATDLRESPSFLRDRTLLGPLSRGETVSALECQWQRPDGRLLELSIFAAPLEPASAHAYV